MGVGRLIARLDGLAGRFNRWFGATAVAAGAEHSGAAGGPPVVDPTAVVAALGETDRAGRREHEDEDDSPRSP